MSFFDRFRRKRRHPAGDPSGRTLAELRAFIAERHGVEAYIEPPTTVYAMSLCLVAADGEYLRRPVKDDTQARKLCADQGVPVYDARIVGYPKRMREYQKGHRQTRIELDQLPPLDVTDDPRHPGADD